MNISVCNGKNLEICFCYTLVGGSLEARDVHPKEELNRYPYHKAGVGRPAVAPRHWAQDRRVRGVRAGEGPCSVHREEAQPPAVVQFFSRNHLRFSMKDNYGDQRDQQSACRTLIKVN
ncbi:hypothetical protein H920_08595 [Fukomys damarensis]|uniref:Uncharacterized protein n=1 Tax=Fukomys damarensis TaxID=885580 RepID=A0A091DFY5_FUKDA|nr:hypothetical protein H920_08595 [Fukomys damarensis]